MTKGTQQALQPCERQYGLPPEHIAVHRLDWREYMHYLYLPVVMMRYAVGLHLPARLEFARPLIMDCIAHEGDHDFEYVYLTARRGYATPGNPLNRPGWHCDGFGTDDVNYIWTDAYPTLFAVQPFEGISPDHAQSMFQFEAQIQPHSVVEYPVHSLLRLDPFVVHGAPTIESPGERSFIKVSFSNSQYNLRGNSHNYLFDYDWQMYDRAELRNDPAYQGKDSGPQNEN